MTNSSVTIVDHKKKKTVFIIAAISAGYLLLSFYLIGFKPEQVVLVLLFNTLYFISEATRKFITGFSVFIIFWILFDYMKAFPNYNFNGVHIKDLYDAEKELFGINNKGNRITPNEYWLQHGNNFLTICSGIFYLCWVPVPLAFAVWLFFKNKTQFFYFSLTFLLANLIGFALYYIYPAAPPWYVQQYGFQLQSHVPGNTAGLGRFDHLVHAGIFQSLYAKSSNVFAAMPSLHAAYPLIVLYYGLKNKVGLINILFVIIMAGIWFSAVYNSHHYILDILAGIGCAVIAIVFFQWLVKNVKWVGLRMQMLVKAIE
jgi:hypothetical protein